MIIKRDTKGTLEGFEALIKTVASTQDINGLLILSCDENQYTVDDINQLITSIDTPLFGGIFPTIVYGNQAMQKGNIIIGLSTVSEIHTIPGLSDHNIDYESLLDEKIPDLGAGKTMAVFVDGFAKRIGAFIESLYTVFGLDINYIGGGAGSLSMEQQPCLFTNKGLVEDSAVIALFEADSGVGVAHGWTSLSGPYNVTESEHNTIKTLDWRPAFEVYHEIVSSHIKSDFTPDNFFEVSKAYPFGITRMDDELIVRDPVQVNPDQSLVCVGEVPEGSFVSILNGDEISLIDAARKASQLGIASFPDEKTKGLIFIMDCISRVLFLEERFKLELEAANYKELPMIGACSIGEIANNGTEFLEFYNKTCVVAIVE